MKKIEIIARKALWIVVILALALALCTGCSGNSSESSGDAQPPASAEEARAAQVNPLDAAFDSGKTVRLIPKELPAGPGEDYMPVGISPDGGTVLWRNKEGMAVSRNGETRPVVFNAERGAGDPYHQGERISLMLKRLPFWEGFSWSADGRYVALSALEASNGNHPFPFSPAVLDTAAGEFFLAKAYNPELREDNAGIVYLNRIDRAGRYLYYLVREWEGDDSHLRFCRCPVEGGDREVLCDMVFDNMAYLVAAYSALYEAQDGSWILNGFTTNESHSYDQYALIHFSPSGKQWTQKVIPTGVPNFGQAIGSISCFAQSGYGLFCLIKNSSIPDDFSVISEEAVLQATATPVFFNRINLMRILPGMEARHDVWCMVKTADGSGETLIPSDDILWAYKIQFGIIAPEEEPAAAVWLSENDNDGEDLFRKFYPDEIRETDMRGEGVCNIMLTCMSPDGRYALLNAGSGAAGYKLYLVRLDTMQLLPVEAPEGIAGYTLTYSAFGREFMPGIVWNEDGTLLIQNSDTRLTSAYQLETGPAQ